jgi:NAD(P)-dependent dehydrogenase (short-subunit alcohol dehydrogenase family)
MPNSANTPRRTLLLTGASRGIGHATVIRFSSAGWRVITCSRHPFPEECPWGAGPEDHIQVDLADHDDTTRAISEIRERLEGGELHALVNNAAISPKAAGGGRLGSVDTDIETWSHVFRVNFFAPIMMARGLPRSCRREPRRSSISKSRCIGWARRTRWPRSSMYCARRQVPTSTAPRSTSTAASTCKNRRHPELRASKHDWALHRGPPCHSA